MPILREEGRLQVQGFAAGSCKPVFCPRVNCRVLTGGEPCRFPDLALPSKEAVGMNVFELVQQAGWPIQRLTAGSGNGLNGYVNNKELTPPSYAYRS